MKILHAVLQFALNVNVSHSDALQASSFTGSMQRLGGTFIDGFRWQGRLIISTSSRLGVALMANEG
jgi:hypothetical protein